MTWTLPILLFQSMLSLPPVGYVKTPLGLTPLYGVRSNFVLGMPQPDVQSAVRLHGVDALKLPGEIRIFNGLEHHIPVVNGVAFFTLDPDSGTLYVWMPDSCELLRWKAGEVHRIFPLPCQADTIGLAFTKPDKLQIFLRAAKDITALTYDARSLQLISTSTIRNIASIAIDTKGNRWTAVGTRVSCGTREWDSESPVTAIEPLDQGWVLVTTPARKWAARCESEDLSAIPQTGSEL